MKGDDKPECFKYAYNNSNSFHAASFGIIKHFAIHSHILLHAMCFVLNMSEGNLVMTDLSLSKPKVIVYNIFFKLTSIITGK